MAIPDPVPVNPAPPVTKRGVLPTAKLLSAVATMIVLYILRQFTDVDEDLEEILNLTIPIVVAYLVPNSDTPGGVPDARPVLRDEAGQSAVELLVVALLVLVIVIVALRYL
jgi:hypothetical protein